MLAVVNIKNHVVQVTSGLGLESNLKLHKFIQGAQAIPLITNADS